MCKYKGKQVLPSVAHTLKLESKMCGKTLVVGKSWWRMQVFIALFFQLLCGLEIFSKLEVGGNEKNRKAIIVIETFILHGLYFHLVPWWMCFIFFIFGFLSV